MINIFIDVLAGTLNALGGYHWLFCRRFIMPVVIGVAVSIAAHTWWLGFICLGAMGTLCIGYSGRGNAWRAFWIFLQAVVLSVFVMLLGHLAWYFFAPYIVLGGVLGGLYRHWDQVIGDFVTGFYLSSFIWLVH